MTHELSPLVSRDYGDQYFDAAMATVDREDGTDFTPDQSAPCKAIEHALLSKNPDEHYSCDKTSIVLGALTSHAPAFITDTIAKFLAGTQISEHCLAMTSEDKDSGNSRKAADDYKNDNVESSKDVTNNINANNYPVTT